MIWSQTARLAALDYVLWDYGAPNAVTHHRGGFDLATGNLTGAEHHWTQLRQTQMVRIREDNVTVNRVGPVRRFSKAPRFEFRITRVLLEQFLEG